MPRYRIDWIPLGVCLALFAASLSMLWSSLSLGWACLYALVLLILKNAALAAQHNHAHLKLFRTRSLNTAYDILLAQLTGYSTVEWELQHARGHHQNYLEPLSDLTSPVNERGETLGLWHFTWQGTVRTFHEAHQIARADAERGRPRALRRLWVHLGLQMLFSCVWLWLNPVMGLIFFVASNLLCRAMLWWGTYWQHINAPCTHVYDASNTTTNAWLNGLIFNNGYHTAHHEQPGLHWSKLPERTRSIQSRIPSQCLRNDINFHLPPEIEPAAS